MNPAKRSAQVIGAISVVRSGQSEAENFAAALEVAPHVLDLGSALSDHNLIAADQPGDGSPIEVQTPGELSERILRALFGQWPQK